MPTKNYFHLNVVFLADPPWQVCLRSSCLGIFFFFSCGLSAKVDVWNVCTVVVNSKKNQYCHLKSTQVVRSSRSLSAMIGRNTLTLFLTNRLVCLLVLLRLPSNHILWSSSSQSPHTSFLVIARHTFFYFFLPPHPPPPTHPLLPTNLTHSSGFHGQFYLVLPLKEIIINSSQLFSVAFLCRHAAKSPIQVPEWVWLLQIAGNTLRFDYPSGMLTRSGN